MKLTEAEWDVMNVLWSGKRFALGQVVEALKPVTGWSRNTVHTYLTRMEKKGLVAIDHSQAKPYSAQVSREDCAKAERETLLHCVYGGMAGDLVAAFLKESTISQEERERLKRLLDDMEV